MKVLKIPVEFTFGDEVYLKTDTEQTKRIVTNIILKPKDIVYMVSASGYDDSYHYDFELSSEKDEVLKVS